MRYRLVVSSLAQQEIAKALNYYYDIDPFVAERFSKCLKRRTIDWKKHHSITPILEVA